eukprot:TRINITY_DN5019_c1_g1_i2.p1 TRINITY_DN5019_c1_g1~~TRINITY_DN5019_c1_g1_i2.p1  ORF type:complete len:319 (+),score=68.23 TRINITY_DN5019_c1_g1_i2:27-959(+)
MSFASHNWDSDDAWKQYIANITISDPSKEAQIVDKYKRRYYKKNIDPNFDDTPPSSSSSSSGGHSHTGDCGCMEHGDLKGTSSSRKEAAVSSAVIYDSFPVGPLSCNCCIIGDPATREAALVDPGGDADIIKKKIADANVQIKWILVTHAHFDHFLAAEEIRKHTGAKVVLNTNDAPLWAALPIQCGMFGFPAPKETIPTPEHLLKQEEESIVLGGSDGIACRAIHTPGHSPGSTCYYFEKGNIVFTGDTLFRDSVGRTDLWGGSKADLVKSIKTKIYALPPGTYVVPGHGPTTSIGRERESNSVVRSPL